MENTAITVKQLNTYVKNLLESDVHLTYLSVSGEISNFKNHYSSGHWYFTLKDKDAQVRCVMFNSYASRVAFEVEDGAQVILKGRVSLYERDGQYQFYAEEILPLGEGDLALAFNRLKDKLQKEGLFDPEHKRPLVRFPGKIAVITSDTGAAVRDIINILSKRYPICDVLLCPVAVQGDLAAKSMIDALKIVYTRDDVDTIIIGRGGGSLEDLWAFNDESLARKIFESPIPVISAVGHETDFTICDFVADIRASTPSHAAELAVPDISVLL
ncbi:MAG: exodeoxyribonuclease VII large subunit, partial [Clostridia bacterium]|nr:exodeoxyribonuclease VII large subunit [Clostridia bacterium]